MQQRRQADASRAPVPVVTPMYASPRSEAPASSPIPPPPPPSATVTPVSSESADQNLGTILGASRRRIADLASRLGNIDDVNLEGLDDGCERHSDNEGTEQSSDDGSSSDEDRSGVARRIEDNDGVSL